MVDVNAEIELLKTRVEQLEQVPIRPVLEIAVDLTLLTQRVDRLFELMRTQKAWIEAGFDSCHQVRQDTQKLVNAYCQLLPERYARDFHNAILVPDTDNAEQET